MGRPWVDAGSSGKRHAAYRSFEPSGVSALDDCMSQACTRSFSRAFFVPMNRLVYMPDLDSTSSLVILPDTGVASKHASVLFVVKSLRLYSGGGFPSMFY